MTVVIIIVLGLRKRCAERTGNLENDKSGTTITKIDF